MNSLEQSESANRRSPASGLFACPRCGREPHGEGDEQGYELRCCDIRTGLENSASNCEETWNVKVLRIQRQANVRMSDGPVEDPAAVEIIRRLESELADNERWMREVLTDFRIPFDDHKIGRRLAFTRWMFERQSSNEKLRRGSPRPRRTCDL